MALQEEMDEGDDMGGMEILASSGLDMLGEAENGVHHIKAKMDLEWGRKRRDLWQIFKHIKS